MVLRVLGLKKEETYGVLKTGVTGPDFHHRMSSGDFGLKDDPITDSGGSRMDQLAKPGVAKPSGSSEGKVDLKRIGHYLCAFFDQYVFTEAEDEDDYNTHEFYGREDQLLSSFHGWATFDEFQKELIGMLLDTFKLEVSNEWVEQSCDWIYKNESSDLINSSTYTVRDVEGAVPVMFYDVAVELKHDNTEVNLGVKNSFSFEGANNHNQDGTIGLGSRFPQKQALAQKRDIKIAIGSVLSRDVFATIRAIEYGAEGITSPSVCKLYNMNAKVHIATCENSDEFLEMLFPECTVKVTYDFSESDEIETKFDLVSLGTGEVTLLDGETTVKTDCYCKLVNDVPEISSSANWV